MVSRESTGRILPTLITLVVVGVMLMTFDIRSDGTGVVGVLRQGTQTLMAPLQKAASYAVNPVVNLVGSLTDVGNLREENAALRRQLAELQAELNTTRDDRIRLEQFEQIFRMRPAGADIGRTVANVIGRVGATVDEALIIDKGTTDGIAVGQPVVDTQNYIVGTVSSVTATSATVVPILSSRQGMTVLVGAAEGTLLPQTGSEMLRLEVFGAREPVLFGEPVLTSAGSLRFPAGWLVGEVVEDAQPSADMLTAMVRPYSRPDTLRMVVVLAWPPDPITAVTPPPTSTTTSTTLPDDSEETDEG
jgi:rod shape-determining protein MreC